MITSLSLMKEEDFWGQLENLLNIGIGLSSEKDIDKLLHMIITEARQITNADAGTLYLKDGEYLVFKIIQNRSLNIDLGGCGEKVDMPPVPLSKENVSSYVAITGKSVNIDDVYHLKGFDFSGPRNYDQLTGYRTKSMMVIPMKDHTGEVIGVLQLINSLKKDNVTVKPFLTYHQKVIESLASQAAIALSNACLIKNIEHLFNSFVEVMATAIDSRTPYNADHTKRVAYLSKIVAEKINESKTRRWAKEYFDKDRMEQLLIAAWLHDIGKIAIPLSIMNKYTRLGSRLELVLQRFDYIYQYILTESLLKEIKQKDEEECVASENNSSNHQEQLEDVLKTKQFIQHVNLRDTTVDEKVIAHLKEIACCSYYDLEGNLRPYLTSEELQHLTIKKGTLTEDERRIMEEHVQVTDRLLSKIPFTNKFKNVRAFSTMHHERLDGTGYPKGLKGDDIPIEGRILALVDIFDSLTAGDRPYRKAFSVEDALNVLESLVEDGKLDKDLFEIFKEHKVWEMVI